MSELSPATPIDARLRDIGGFTVRRLLPWRGRRMVGPFVYFDHMGPVGLEAGRGVDVLPHPHIGLATVTYLYEGVLLHRDSLGTAQVIRPGDVNWMTAGRGIVHSERTPPAERASGPRLHGLQLWVALPTADEEIEPSFRHHPAATLPEMERGGVRLRLMAGSAWGATSPVEVRSPLFYVDVAMPAGSELPLTDEHAERAVLARPETRAVYANVDNQVTLPAFTRFDAALYWSATESIQMQLNIENLTDKRYFASAHSNNNITPGAPRSAWVSLNFAY